MPKASILLAVSEPARQNRLEIALSWNGFEAFSVPSGESALLQLGFVLPNLVLLDLEAEEKAGWETVRRIRAVTPVPVICLAAPDQSDAYVEALRTGADLCLTRTAGIRGPRARVRALIRRAHGNQVLVEL
jgi:DNA-binding response OmpR family regulator